MMIAAQGTYKAMKERTDPLLKMLGITGKAAGEKNAEDLFRELGSGF